MWKMLAGLPAGYPNQPRVGIQPEAAVDGAILDFLIVGIGPGGLQWATLLEKQPQITYVVLEKEARAASFYTIFPRARRMISHNKCRTGSIQVHPDFKMRHDWHSLLDAPAGFKMCNVSDEYYPHADDVVRYYEHIATGLGSVRYNTSVAKIDYSQAPDRTPHVVHTQGGRSWRARHVIIATGLEPSKVPKALLDQAKNTSLHPSGSKAGQSQVWYDYGSFPSILGQAAPWCEDKYITLIGAGNAAFEVADLLKSCAAKVGMIGRSPPKFAAETHYVGHVRLQKLGIMDRFLLKTLDTYSPVTTAGIREHAFAYRRLGAHGSAEMRIIDEMSTGFSARTQVGIFCGGFSGRRPGLVDDMDMNAKGKFPRTDSFYGVRGVPNAWYAGALMHGRDYQISAGGFIHGFRYLVRSQSRFILARDYGVRCVPPQCDRPMRPPHATNSMRL